MTVKQSERFQVTFLDSGHEPQCAPNPDYPGGRDMRLYDGMPARVCELELPYPAPRCGQWMVVCKSCGWSGIITAAGRPDDPRKIGIACKRSA